MGGQTGGTVIRPLSRSARGSAVPLIIDVVGNLCRQETKLPAVPAHYDIIWEGWPTAGAASRHPSRPAAPAVHLLTCRQMNTHFLHIAFQTDVHNAAFPRNARKGKGRKILDVSYSVETSRTLRTYQGQLFYKLFKKRLQHVSGVERSSPVDSYVCKEN